jgi:hypothetical protein
MNRNDFWQLVGKAKCAAGADSRARIEALRTVLADLPKGELESFQRHYDELSLESRRWSLVGAAVLMNGSCTDDGFRYFCHWLISEGHAVYTAALSDPDTLAALPRQAMFELEGFAYVAPAVYQSKFGEELERDFRVEIAPVVGDEWLEADLPRLFPRLAAIYGV